MSSTYMITLQKVRRKERYNFCMTVRELFFYGRQNYNKEMNSSARPQRR